MNKYRTLCDTWNVNIRTFIICSKEENTGLIKVYTVMFTIWKHVHSRKTATRKQKSKHRNSCQILEWNQEKKKFVHAYITIIGNFSNLWEKNSPFKMVRKWKLTTLVNRHRHNICKEWSSKNNQPRSVFVLS